MAIDNWVHRRNFDASEHGRRLRELEEKWKKFTEKQSEIADVWQLETNKVVLHLAEIEAHLKYIDKQNDTHRPRDRR